MRSWLRSLLVAIAVARIQVGAYPEQTAPSRELFVASAAARLPATLTLPPGTGPFPGVVLVHGSGPHDRDESIGLNKPFLDLAAGLARRGIASLRYVKRTVLITAAPANLNFAWEVVDDAREAASVLASQPEIEKGRIYYVGHSFGAYLLPRIAAGGLRPAGLIMMAGFCRSALISEQLKTAPEIVLPESYLQDVNTYDPVDTIRGDALPLLLLQGGQDANVPPLEYRHCMQSLNGVDAVLSRFYPDLNHLFIYVPAPWNSTDPWILGHVSEQVMDDISSWIHRGQKRRIL